MCKETDLASPHRTAAAPRDAEIETLPIAPRLGRLVPRRLASPRPSVSAVTLRSEAVNGTSRNLQCPENALEVGDLVLFIGPISEGDHHHLSCCSELMKITFSQQAASTPASPPGAARPPWVPGYELLCQPTLHV